MERVHFSHLKKVPAVREVYFERPEQGLCPDVQQVLYGVLGMWEIQGEVQQKVKKSGRNGFVWMFASDFKDVVVTAYEVGREDRSGV